MVNYLYELASQKNRGDNSWEDHINAHIVKKQRLIGEAIGK